MSHINNTLISVGSEILSYIYALTNENFSTLRYLTMVHHCRKSIGYILLLLMIGPKISDAFVRNPKRFGIMHSINSLSSVSYRRRTLTTALELTPDIAPSEFLGFIQQLNLSVDQDQAEALAGPFFGLSLFPYLAFLYFLNVRENKFPKGVTVGFATCLLFVFLTIPAAIAAKLLYGVSLADCDWLHGSAESLLTVTNLVTVVAFRQALNAKDKDLPIPKSAASYVPMVWLVVILTGLATLSAVVPALLGSEVHSSYLGGCMDLSYNFESLGSHPEPENALTVATWIIHISSLVEFLVAMGFAWRWADVVENPKWKGLTWGLLPLHSSGITACVYHLLYNRVPIMIPLQAILTCIGNTTAAYAALRIALSNGWVPSMELFKPLLLFADQGENASSRQDTKEESASLVGFEDIGDVLEGDHDLSFLLKLFLACAVASYVIKYGETFFDFPYEAQLYVGLSLVLVPSLLNALKWYKRSQDATFKGWL